MAKNEFINLDSISCELPNELKLYRNIKSLFYGHNYLIKITNIIFEMSNLEHLFLNYNKLTSIPKEIIKLVSQNIEIPLIVGGGIIDLQGIQKAYDSGADLVVIGTAFENDIDFFNK